MSTEQIIDAKDNPLMTSQDAEANNKKISSPVDINNLLARVRKEEQKANKINFIFFFMFALLVLIVGILLSL